jgi:glutathione peroxidase
MTIYDFIVADADGNDVSMGDYKGKALLIVNTATGCGFTPQLGGIETLYEKYKNRGFEVLSFPCNQFLGQSPGTNQEIVQFCQVNYHVTFKTFAKIDVNGVLADPLFTYLKEQIPQDEESVDSGGFLNALKGLKQQVLGNSIKWNFTKFLVDREGRLIRRYSPTFKPEAIDPDIAALL